MATSQNGWPIVGKSACDQGPFEGVTFPNGILKGDVATIARWQLRQYKARVEPLVRGTCWGWFVKLIEGSTTKSNHGSATAWDINADQHPMGVPASHNMSAHEISQCHAIEAESHGTLRWGGDFSRPDPMHWEIIGSRAQVAAFAAWIREQEEEDMTVVDISDESIDKLAGAIVSKYLSQDLGKPGGGDTMGVVYQTGVLGNSNKILAKLDEISAKLSPAEEPTP